MTPDSLVRDSECQDILRGLLLGLPGVREGKMFGVPAFFLGRKLFTCLFGDVVGIKVPHDMAQRLLEDPRFEPFQPYGKARMREWVQFSCAPQEDMPSYEEILLAAYEYVAAEAAK